MLPRSWIGLLVLLIIGGCGQDRQNKNSSVSSPKKYKTIIYFQNGSDTEPQSDLEIRRNDSLVFAGTVVFDNIPDYWHSIALQSSDSIQHLSILHKPSATQLDTVVASTNALTHVFLTYGYHKLTKEDSLRFKRFAHNAEEEVEMRKMFDEPRQFSVLVMTGQISIP